MRISLYMHKDILIGIIIVCVCVCMSSTACSPFRCIVNVLLYFIDVDDNIDGDLDRSQIQNTVRYSYIIAITECFHSV